MLHDRNYTCYTKLNKRTSDLVARYGHPFGVQSVISRVIRRDNTTSEYSIISL